MMQNEMDREIEQIRQTIIGLARRKYIYKSELRNILSGCRVNTVSLEDLERLMYSVIDETVSYLDDTSVSDPFPFCIRVYEDIKEAGFTDLFRFLSVRTESTLLEITEAYRRMNSAETKGDLYGKIGLLIAAEGCLDIYRHLYSARDVLDTLSLRSKSGLLYLSEDERQKMIGNLVAGADMEPDMAREIIDSYLQECGIVVLAQKEHRAAIAAEETVDEFLVPVRQISADRKNTGPLQERKQMS